MQALIGVSKLINESTSQVFNSQKMQYLVSDSDSLCKVSFSLAQHRFVHQQQKGPLRMTLMKIKGH